MKQTQLATMLAAEEDKLLACVHCGLCLEACPTYIKTGDENDSPRGRIYLMRAVEEERLAADSKTFERHINRCLGCRACEQACPAGVQYGQLLEAARSDLSQRGAKRSLTSRTLRFVLRHVWLHPARLRFAFALARIVRDGKLARLLLWSRLPRLISRRTELALLLLESSAPSNTGDGRKDKEEAHAPARKAVSKDVSVAINTLLFKGCVTEGLFARVNRATARVLLANGCETNAPQAQVCCGALHAHAGDTEGARALARQNIEAFADSDASIITNAGGCGAMLVSYAHLLADDEEYAERAQRFSARVRDISQQLALTGIKQGTLSQDAIVTYDASCHLLYGQRATEEPLQMLRAIKGIRLVPLEGSVMCCGGAGVYNLLEMELSARVLDEKLAHLRETGAGVLATGNPGCQMQIGAGARLAGMNLRVCHPVELLDESYRSEDQESGEL